MDRHRFEKYLWENGAVVFSESDTEIRYFHEQNRAYAGFHKEAHINPETVHAVCWTLGISTPADVLDQVKSAPVLRRAIRRKVRE